MMCEVMRSITLDLFSDHTHFANALANANVRSSPCPACRSVKLTTVVTLATTTSFKALVGAQAKRDIKPIFIIDFLI